MKKYCLKNSLIGNYYPFFLSNSGIDDSFYLYQVVSPGLKNYVPTVSLEKVGEKTKKGDYSGTEKDMRSTDLFAFLFGTRENLLELEKKYLENNVFFKNKTKIFINNSKPTEFPEVELGMDNNNQKAMIINIRDDIRWKSYKFSPGYSVDVLWTPNSIISFQIQGDNNKIWLDPQYMFYTSDPWKANVIYPDWDESVLKIKNHTFSGDNRASGLNRFIKQLEWNAFK